MSHTKPLHILLINPPVQSPAMPPLMPAQVAAILCGPDLIVEQFDAGLDFFLHHLLDAERLTDLLIQIEKRKKDGAYEKKCPENSFSPDALLDDLSESPDKWRRRITDASKSLRILTTDDFYLPDRFLTAQKNICDLLDLVSISIFPSRIEWRRFSNFMIKDWGDVPPFLENPEVNPFISFFHDRLSPRLDRQEPNLLILCVSGLGQLLSALTMARLIKRSRSNLPIAMLGESRLLKGATEFSDHLLPESDPRPLLDLISRLGGVVAKGETLGPDFSGFPLADYLAPGRVLPLGFRMNSGNQSRGSPSLLAVLAEQRKVFGADGFLIKEMNGSPQQVLKMLNGPMKKESPFCMGLKWAFNSPPSREAMTAAYQAGVKLIQWQNPGIQLESITDSLLNTSTAGIWNHVMIPEGSANRINEGIISFLALNPNIAHSWVWVKSSSSLFFGPATRVEEEFGGYAKMTRLPGRPMWQHLSDPVYLLLYLNRYNLKTVLRWRPRDDGASFYTIGQHLLYHFVPPQELPPGYLDEICRMVEAGGSVDSQWVKYNLKRAFLIGYAQEEGVVVGNSSLKRPRPEYIESVKERSGLDLSQFLERGYTSVRPEYRGLGIGTRLLEGLTARIGDRKLFSIISEDNIATQKIAIRNRTKKVATFYSESSGKEIGVWIPIWMLED